VTTGSSAATDSADRDALAGRRPDRRWPATVPPVIVSALVLGALRAPLLAPHSPMEGSLGERLVAPLGIFEGAKRLTRTALVGLGAMIFLAPVVAAQSPVKTARIGILASGTASTQAARYEAFRQGLNELGYVEGRNIVIEYRYAEGKSERLPALAAELVRLKVDLILTAGDQGVRAAKQASQTIPIVVALVNDLVGPGYVASLARPGGNITGLTTLTSELSAKRLELLKTAFPKVSRVAILWNPSNAGNVTAFKETEAAARALRIQLVPLDVRRADDFESAFPAALRARADALIAMGDALLVTHRARIADFAAKNRLPAMYGNEDYMDAGGLMFYGPNVADMYRRAATYVDKILKGAKPGDLPVEQPTKLELVVNVKTAKALGLTFLPSFLLRADRVIE
jgi:putative ABC transport system substrate-binding protein